MEYGLVGVLFLQHRSQNLDREPTAWLCDRSRAPFVMTDAISALILFDWSQLDTNASSRIEVLLHITISRVTAPSVFKGAPSCNDFTS